MSWNFLKRFGLFFQDESGLSLMETIISISILGVVFSLLFSSLFRISNIMTFNSNEMINQQELVNKTEICLRDIRESDHVFVDEKGMTMILAKQDTLQKRIYRLERYQDPSTELYYLTRTSEGSGKQTLLRNLLPPPESHFALVQREQGRPIVQVRFTIRVGRVTLRNDSWTTPRGRQE